jgi:hypothetical protein
MIKHLLGLVAAIAFVLFCTLFPFLPGRYDPLAIPVSAMAQAGALLGLALVPFGLLWILADRSPRLAQKRAVFILLATAASTLAWIGVFFAGLTMSGYTLGVVVLVLWVLFLKRVYGWFKQRGSTAQTRSALPYYLVIVPVVVVLLQFALLKRAVEFSRNRAIENSAPLIGAIEDYRVANGRYPASLHASWPDFLPYVVGIEQYHYEPHGESYNLFFEQFAYSFGTQEYVMYNPRDEHVMTSHAMDLLELTPEQLAVERTRGHHARNDAPQPHWKYFWFD